MAAPPRRGLARLVSQDGHVHWAEPVLRFLLANPAGYAIIVECDFGERPMVHYIGRDASGRAGWQNEPYAFASIAQAEAARDELASAQQQGEAE